MSWAFFQGCFKAVSRVFQGGFKYVSRTFHESLKISRVLQGRFKLFKGNFKFLSRVRFEGVSMLIQECFMGKGLSGVFLGSGV